MFATCYLWSRSSLPDRVPDFVTAYLRSDSDPGMLFATQAATVPNVSGCADRLVHHVQVATSRFSPRTRSGQANFLGMAHAARCVPRQTSPVRCQTSGRQRNVYICLGTAMAISDRARERRSGLFRVSTKPVDRGLQHAHHAWQCTCTS